VIANVKKNLQSHFNFNISTTAKDISHVYSSQIEK